jgi:hypothetical protein
MAVDFESFKKFTPERRITELQNIIDRLKKQIDEKEEEIKGRNTRAENKRKNRRKTGRKRGKTAERPRT